MRALFCMSFEKKKEYIVECSKFVEYQLGDALITVLTTDLKPFVSKLEHYELYSNHALMEADIVKETIAALEPIHPFFESVILPVKSEKNPMKSLYIRVGNVELVQKQVTPIVDAVLLDDGTELTPMQRLCMYLSNDHHAATIFAGLGDLLMTERQIYINGKPFEPFFFHDWNIDPPQDISVRQIIGSNDLRTILLTELEEMAQQNIRLRRCERCHKYFRPFSAKSLYCDRLVGNTGKTCQELAAKEKYEKKVAADEGLTLYRRRNKTYAMRVSRAPDVYRDADYQAWKAAAEVALQQYTDGEITLEMLDVMIELPEKK
ncbi:DUF6076 domain-containing protein [Dysosmobacter sp.]